MRRIRRRRMERGKRRGSSSSSADQLVEEVVFKTTCCMTLMEIPRRLPLVLFNLLFLANVDFGLVKGIEGESFAFVRRNSTNHRQDLPATQTAQERQPGTHRKEQPLTLHDKRTVLSDVQSQSWQRRLFLDPK